MASYQLIVTRTDFTFNGKRVNPRHVDPNLYDRLKPIMVIEEIKVSKSGKAPLRKWLRENGFHYEENNIFLKPVDFGVSKKASIKKINI